MKFYIMNKRTIFILGLIALFLASAYFTNKFGKIQGENVVADEVTFNNSEEENTIQTEVLSTAVDEEKITPNTTFMLKKHYTDCGHTIIDKAEIPEELVNLNEEELKEKYPKWEIEKFSKEEVVLLKELDSFCGEHYLVTEEDGNVLIYMIDEKGSKSLVERTDIAFDYLPESDKTILKNGIYVYGNEELNKIREDFES